MKNTILSIYVLIICLITSLVSCAQTIEDVTQTQALNIDFMEPNEAYPFIKFNEAVNKIDALIFGKLASKYPEDASPDVVSTDLSTGDIVIVPSAGEGEWSGKTDYIGQWQADDTWEYFIPKSGWTVTHATRDQTLRYNGSEWAKSISTTVLGQASPAVSADGNYDDGDEVYSITDNNLTFFEISKVDDNGFQLILHKLSPSGSSTQSIISLRGDDGSARVGSGGMTVGDDSLTAPDTILDVSGPITLRGNSVTGGQVDPADPDIGNSVLWQANSSSAYSDAGDILMKINVGGTVKAATLVDFSSLP